MSLEMYVRLQAVARLLCLGVGLLLGKRAWSWRGRGLAGKGSGSGGGGGGNSELWGRGWAG